MTNYKINNIYKLDVHKIYLFTLPCRYYKLIRISAEGSSIYTHHVVNISDSKRTKKTVYKISEYELNKIVVRMSKKEKNMINALF